MKAEKVRELENKIRKDYSNTAGMVVLKNGETLYENYFNECTAANHIHIFSVTKSIVSLLVGIAIEKGAIQSIHQKVLDFFPDYTVKAGEENIQNITLENLLTMTAPYKYSLSESYAQYFASDDWVQFSLDSLDGSKPVGTFQYAPLIGPDILSGILVRTTGQPVLKFATENLFAPLGISVAENITFQNQEEQFAFYQAKNVNGWVAGPTGVNTAGWGLTLSTTDMAKIGQLCLNGGRWNEQQIVPVAWIAEITSEHSRWEEMNLPYGYLWWIIDDAEQACAAMGDGGNVIYFNRQKNIVVAISSLFMENAADRIGLIKEAIEPLCEEEA